MSEGIDSERTERRRDLMVGFFVLVTLLMGVAVILLLGRQHHVFEPRVRLRTSFADVSGLREGAPVWLAGVNVGTVTRVAVGRPGEQLVRVEMLVSRAVVDRVRTDSVATIGSQGLLGDKIIDLSMGSADLPAVTPGAEISSQPATDLNKVVDRVGVILERVKVVADNAAVAMRALASPESIADFRSALGSLRALLHQAKTGPGLAHALFYDRRTSDDLQAMVAQLKHVSARLDTGLAALDGILQSTDADGRQVVNNLSRAASGVGKLAGSVERTRILANLEHAAGDVSALTQRVRSGQGTIGALINDPTLYDQLLTVFGGVERSRILRALVRFAIKKKQGEDSAKEVNAPPLRR